MNKVILVGNICKDVELKYTTNNVPIIKNSIAIKNDYKNSNGEYATEYINLVIWKQCAEYLSNYAKKGTKILVEGRLTTRKYDDNGTKRYITEVQAEKVQILSLAKKENKEETPEIKQEPEQIAIDPYEEFANEIDDNDLPF